MKTVTIVVPCYNEEEALPIYFEAVDPVIKGIEGYSFSFLLVNDGSKDKTLEIMEDLYEKRDDVSYISLSRNFGQDCAVSAGLQHVDSDYAITMDVDLQDPVTVIPEIIIAFEEGYDVACPHRASRKKDTFFKRNTAKAFYKTINKLEGREVIPANVSLFRGLSRRAYTTVNNLPEADRHLLNEYAFIGFKRKMIDFERPERSAGKSKYSVRKLVSYALSLITSGTSKPLYLPLFISFFFNMFSLLGFLTFLVFFILGNLNFAAFSLSWVTPCFILFGVFTAVSLLGIVLGIYGIYLHNVLLNSRGRPNYIIDIFRKKEDKSK